MAITEQSLVYCKSCGEPLESGWTRCPVCAPQRDSGAMLICPSCGCSVKAHWRECPKCNSPLGGYVTPSGSLSGGPVPSTRLSTAERPQVFVTVSEAGAPCRSVELPIAEGDVLGERYTIRGLLGAGGFGAVYHAYDSVTKDNIALKIVVAAEEEGHAQRAAEQILHEFKLRQKINEVAHIVKCGDPRPTNLKGLSLVLLPMELASGGNLRQWLAQNKDVGKRHKQALEFFRQACRGAKAIHDAGLLHLDIKPENILVADGKAKLSDFGLGRFGPMASDANPDQLLRQGIGTPQYMSPEQFRTARQRDIGPTSDIYSLGLILYEIVDGTAPFDGSPFELREKHINLAPVQPSGVSDSLWRVIESCLAKAPKDRYDRVDRLLKDLERTEQGAATSVDVSCPKCDHLNTNPDHRVCENCQASLDPLFRSCRICARRVRRDVERCPGCGEAILAYYLLHQRWSDLEAITDEDPVEAINLLELILREGAGEFQDRALPLLRELRHKQERISGLVAQADRAHTVGSPEEALAAWRAVLEIAPRHGVASEKAKALDRLLHDFRDTLAKGNLLADQANFEQAEACLKRSQAMIPANEEVRKQLLTVAQRAKAYATAIKATRAERDARRLGAARECVRAALAEASQNKEALALASAIDEAIKASERQLKQARKHIRCAEFEAATTAVKKFLELRADAEEGNRVRDELSAARDTFSSAIETCEQAVRERDLGAAAKAAQQSLQVCPDCSRAKDMYATILNDEKVALQHLKRANEALASARFTDANTELELARRLWPLMEGLTEARGDINSTRPIYERQLEAARTLGLKRQYDMACAACHEALRVCRRAKEPGEVLRGIEAIKIGEEAREHRRRAQKRDRIQLTLRLLVVLSILGGVVAVAIHQRAWVQTALWPWLVEQLKQ